MKRLKQFTKTLWNDQSGQGATEYILLLVVVVALAVLFKDRIMGVVGEKLNELGSSIGSFTGSPQ